MFNTRTAKIHEISHHLSGINDCNAINKKEQYRTLLKQNIYFFYHSRDFIW